MSELFWLIPLLPGAGAFVNGLFGKRLPKSLVSAVACGSIGLSFLLALACFFGIFWSGGGTAVQSARLFTWIPGMDVVLTDGTLGTLNIAWEYRLDSLSMVMALVVAGVGFLIHVYSIGYMGHDPGYARYFSYLNLFSFFMLNLVLAANFLLMFIGWEGVGLCSYLLIGFWYERKSAADAGKKAFIVNRIGDAGFLLAMMLIFVNVRLPRFLRGDGLDCRSASRSPRSVGVSCRLSASCCSSAPPVSRRRFLFTSGCPTPWKVPHRCQH